MEDHEFRDFFRDKLALDAQKKWTLLEAVPISEYVLKPAPFDLNIQGDSETDTSTREAPSQLAVEQPVLLRTEVRAAVQRSSAEVARNSSLFSQKQGPEPKPRLIATTSEGNQTSAARKTAGLFSNLNAASLRQPAPSEWTMNEVSNDASLASVFLRLEQSANKQNNVLGCSQFFARLGRKCM